MKMELVLPAPQDCVVHQWLVKAGDSVAEGQVAKFLAWDCLYIIEVFIVLQLLAFMFPVTEAFDEKTKAAAAAAAATELLKEEADRAVRVSVASAVSSIFSMNVTPSTGGRTPEQVCCALQPQHPDSATQSDNTAGLLPCRTVRVLQPSLGGGRRDKEPRVKT